MWHKFIKVDARGRLPKMHYGTHYISADGVTIWSLYDHLTQPIVGVLPSGEIVDDFKSPGCDPYFIITFELFFDVVTDGKKYSWIDNVDNVVGSHNNCYYVKEQCKLSSGKPDHPDLTTRDARIIKALIKAHLEEPNVA